MSTGVTMEESAAHRRVSSQKQWHGHPLLRVILSAVNGSRSEAFTKSKDPANVYISNAAARRSPRDPEHSTFILAQVGKGSFDFACGSLLDPHAALRMTEWLKTLRSA
jgi:hypothetical protein